MQAVLALRGVARRRSGSMVLVMLAAVVVLPKLATLLPSEQALRDAHVAAARQYYYYTPQPQEGWGYHGFLMDWHGAPPPPRPQPGNGGRNLAAGLGAALEGREQDDPVLAGTELASGRRANDDVEAKESKPNVDTLDTGSAHLSTPVDTGHAVAPTASDSVGDVPTAKDAEAFHQRIVGLGGPASYPETRLTSVFDATGVPDSLLDHLTITHWYASAPHPFLASVLPGVSFVAATHGSLYNASFTPCAITSDRRLYTVYDLNSLLRAEGFTFDSSEMQTIAKIVVLLAYFATPPPETDTPDAGQFEEHFPPAVELGTQAFPSIEFRSFLREVTQNPYGHGRAFNTRLTVVYRINGVVETAAVGFHGTADGRNSLERFIAPRNALRFQTGWITPLRTTTQGNVGIATAREFRGQYFLESEARQGCGWAECTSVHQLPTARPSTSWKCASRVIRVRPCCWAMAAIHTSFSGMGRPLARSAAFRTPYSRAVATSGTSTAFAAANSSIRARLRSFWAEARAPK